MILSPKDVAYLARVVEALNSDNGSDLSFGTIPIYLFDRGIDDEIHVGEASQDDGGFIIEFFDAPTSESTGPEVAEDSNETTSARPWKQGDPEPTDVGIDWYEGVELDDKYLYHLNLTDSGPRGYESTQSKSYIRVTKELRQILLIDLRTAKDISDICYHGDHDLHNGQTVRLWSSITAQALDTYAKLITDAGGKVSFSRSHFAA